MNADDRTLIHLMQQCIDVGRLSIGLPFFRLGLDRGGVSGHEG